MFQDNRDPFWNLSDFTVVQHKHNLQASTFFVQMLTDSYRLQINLWLVCVVGLSSSVSSLTRGAECLSNRFELSEDENTLCPGNTSPAASWTPSRSSVAPSHEDVSGLVVAKVSGWLKKLGLPYQPSPARVLVAGRARKKKNNNTATNQSHFIFHIAQSAMQRPADGCWSGRQAEWWDVSLDVSAELLKRVTDASQRASLMNWAHRAAAAWTHCASSCQYHFTCSCLDVQVFMLLRFYVKVTTKTPLPRVLERLIRVTKYMIQNPILWIWLF